MANRPIYIYADTCRQYSQCTELQSRLRLLADIKVQIYAYVVSILAHDDLMDHLLPCSNAIFAADISIGVLFTAYQSVAPKDLNIMPHLKCLYRDIQHTTQAYQKSPCRSALMDIEWPMRQFCRLIIFIASIAKKYITRTVDLVRQITTYVNEHRLHELLQSQQLVV